MIDLLIIGGGPAGLASAIKAKKTGVDNILILERSEELGGLLYQCIHNGFGIEYFKEDLTGPEYAYRFIQEIKKLGINYMLETMVLDITPEKEVIALNSEKGVIKLNPKAIILAMGCRERTRFNIFIPGTRPAGVFTAGTAQRLINIEGYIPGDEIVILGSGDIGMIMARRLTLEGAKVKAVAEFLPYIGGLIRNEVQCLRDFNIPIFLRHTVTEIRGKNRLESVCVSEVDNKGIPINGSEEEIKCNTLLLSIGLIPENELSLKAGVKLNPLTDGPIVDENMQTNVNGIFSSGNVLHVNDLVDNVSSEAETAGLNAAKYIMNELDKDIKNLRVEAGKGIKYVIPSYISGDKEVNLYMRVTEPSVNSILELKYDCEVLYKKKFINTKPSEMLKIKIREEVIKKLDKKADKIIISCNGDK